MTALSDNDIKRLWNEGHFVVDPFPSKINPASIDLTLGNKQYQYNFENYILGSEIDSEKDVVQTEFLDLMLEHGDSVYIGIAEKLTIPSDAMGYVFPRSSITRLGIQIIPVFMNPGYTGYMPLTITNHSGKPVTIKPGVRIAQLSLFSLNTKSGNTYGRREDAKYQNEEVSHSQLHKDEEFQAAIDRAVQRMAPNISKLIDTSK